MNAPPKEPLAHIARSPLPWRAAADNDTECGKPVGDFAKVVSWAEAVAFVKEFGQARAAFMLCVTCSQTATRYGWRLPGRNVYDEQLTFDASPTARLEHERAKRREQLDGELRAMAILVQRYPDEFADLVSGRVVPISELRRVKGQ